MKEYGWKEAGKIEGISHKELISLQMLQYMDWFRMDRKIFEFKRGELLFKRNKANNNRDDSNNSKRQNIRHKSIQHDSGR